MKWLRDNGLTIALLALFLGSVVGQAWFGWLSDTQDRSIHGLPAEGLEQYLSGGAFLSALFENWESEFLQMAAFVMLTAHLYQRGSPESRDPDEPQSQRDRDPALNADKPDAPWPVRAGGVWLSLYSHSLGLSLSILFVLSFLFHWINSARHAAEDAVSHGHAPESLMQYLGDAEFWFESFQNWQSEFLSTAVLIVLAIFLRERGSPESKPVAAPHAQTGLG